MIEYIFSLQLSLAARLPRETETTTQSILDSFKQSLDNISDDVGNTLKKTFTRENADVCITRIFSVSNHTDQINVFFPFMN